jgi:hypothetical protein
MESRPGSIFLRSADAKHFSTISKNKQTKASTQIKWPLLCSLAPRILHTPSTHIAAPTFRRTGTFTPWLPLCSPNKSLAPPLGKHRSLLRLQGRIIGLQVCGGYFLPILFLTTIRLRLLSCLFLGFIRLLFLQLPVSPCSYFQDSL